MKNRTLAWCIALVASLPASAQSADEVIAKFVEARGGRAAIDAIETVRASGKAIFGNGPELAFAYEWKRPNKIRFELTQQGITEVQTHDGESGWRLDPSSSPEPEPLPALDLAMLNDGVDYIGPLVDYERKGHTVRLLGKEEIQGTEAYKIEIVKQDGMVEHSFIDTEYFLEILQIEKHSTPQGELQLQVTWSDYKEVAGVLLPHSWNRVPLGAPAGLTLMFEKMEVNVGLPDARFGKPAIDSP